MLPALPKLLNEAQGFPCIFSCALSWVARSCVVALNSRPSIIWISSSRGSMRGSSQTRRSAVVVMERMGALSASSYQSFLE